MTERGQQNDDMETNDAESEKAAKMFTVVDSDKEKEGKQAEMMEMKVDCIGRTGEDETEEEQAPSKREDEWQLLKDSDRCILIAQDLFQVCMWHTWVLYV